MKVDAKEIAESLTGSDKVELSSDKLSARRKGNPALPAFQEKKREAKAADKDAAKESKQAAAV